MEHKKLFFQKCFRTLTCMGRNMFWIFCALTCMFWIFCALHVFFCARVLRPVSARTRAQLRGNIGTNAWAVPNLAFFGGPSP